MSVMLRWGSRVALCQVAARGIEQLLVAMAGFFELELERVYSQTELVGHGGQRGRFTLEQAHDFTPYPFGQRGRLVRGQLGQQRRRVLLKQRKQRRVGVPHRPGERARGESHLGQRGPEFQVGRAESLLVRPRVGRAQ